MTHAGTALFARRAFGDLLVRLHVVAHRFTHVRADRRGLTPLRDPKIGTLT